VRIKICCLQSIEELVLAVRYGADAVGLVSAMPSGPGPIDDALIAAIAARVPPGVSSFLLTSRRDAAAIVDQVRRLRPTTVQLVDRPLAGCHETLRRALPSTRIVQVVHVTGPEAVAEARAAAPGVDALLLDSGSRRSAGRAARTTGTSAGASASR
jgi:phosphoribosylanthranilate isomerase